ncbi:hypothetical protein MBAV_004918 [Candidatus Magnetobacterium bavaricum]|uniref:Uncharacterized protein n=1 Tax=Candidatus Magnetobacterium bavaricum TaxID=29290 RepID=A0A0F3GQG4_9BACT|nr:hypothetical protein MBAV_004918 [Candidatus Magnetobacterium bavaricum]
MNYYHKFILTYCLFVFAILLFIPHKNFCPDTYTLNSKVNTAPFSILCAYILPPKLSSTITLAIYRPIPVPLFSLVVK